MYTAYMQEQYLQYNDLIVILYAVIGRTPSAPLSLIDILSVNYKNYIRTSCIYMFFREYLYLINEVEAFFGDHMFV